MAFVTNYRKGKKRKRKKQEQVSVILTQYKQDMKADRNAFTFFRERTNKMNIIYAEYNIHHNSIDIATTAGYLLQIDCWEAEKELKTTPCSECALNALAIDEPLKYARLYLEGNMQMWIDAEDSLKLW